MKKSIIVPVVAFLSFFIGFGVGGIIYSNKSAAGSQKDCMEQSSVAMDAWLVDRGYTERADGSWADASGRYPEEEDRLEAFGTEVFHSCMERLGLADPTL